MSGWLHITPLPDFELGSKLALEGPNERFPGTVHKYWRQIGKL